MNAKHMMIDLETMATTSSAAILQIGACLFQMETGGMGIGYEWTIPLQQSLIAGGEIDAGATDFWRRKASMEARASVCNPVHMASLEDALAGLAQAYGELDCEYVWSNGAGFDIIILEGYYQRLGIPIPWRYNQARDTRTLWHLAKELGWERPMTLLTAHTGLADAQAQAADVIDAWTWIQSAKMGSVVAPRMGSNEHPNGGGSGGTSGGKGG